MNKQQVTLQPGIYTNAEGKRRVLLAVLGQKCVYSFDDVEGVLTANTNETCVRATTCTARTFVAAVGSVPSRVFSAEEIARLGERVTSSRPRKRCNKFERDLFFISEQEKCTAPEMATSTPESTPTQNAEEPETLSKRGWLGGVLAWLRRKFCGVRQPETATPVPATEGAMGYAR